MVKAESIQYDDNQVPYIDLGTAIIRMEKEEAPEWALEKARQELRELPGIMEPAIKKLRELIEGKWASMKACVKTSFDIFEKIRIGKLILYS